MCKYNINTGDDFIQYNLSSNYLYQVKGIEDLGNDFQDNFFAKNNVTQSHDSKKYAGLVSRKSIMDRCHLQCM